MASAAFTQESENWIRLAALLVEVGTPCLRRLLEKQLPHGYSDVELALQDPAIKQKLTTLHKGGKGIPKVLNDDQWSLLYPSRKQKRVVEGLDITLASVLLYHICNIPKPVLTGKQPAQGDHSCAADIYRIRGIRNSLYGHIAQLKVSDSDFAIEWASLESILKRLGASVWDIDSCKKQSLDTRMELRMKKEIIDLLENDLADFQALCNNITQLVEKQTGLFGGKISAVQQDVNIIKRRLDEDQIQHKSLSDRIIAVLQQMKPASSVALLHALDQSLDNVICTLACVEGKLAHQNISSDKILSGQRQQLKNSKKILKGQKKQLQVMQNIERNTAERKAVVYERCDSTEFQDLTDLLRKHTSSFKILIVTEPDPQINPLDREILSETLGNLKWDIVIDVDHNSYTTGLFDEITHHLKAHKDFLPLRPEEMKGTTERLKRDVASGNKAFWILANGCSEKGGFSAPSSSTQKIRALKANISKLISDTACTFELRKNMLTVILFLSGKSSPLVNKVADALQDVLSTEDIMFDPSLALFMTLVACEGPIDSSVNFDEDYLNKKWEATPNQICFLLDSGLRKHEKTEVVRYHYPGASGLCEIASRELAQLKGVAALLHLDIGRVDFEGLNQEEILEKTEQIRDFYLKGNELTLEAIYIHENFSQSQVFVVRTEMKELKEFIEDHLRRRNNFKRKDHPGYVSIRNDPSGGGSTAIKYVAYQLSKIYPTILVLRNDPIVVEFVKRIARDSKKPVLIVMDFDIHEREVTVLQRTLDNSLIRALVVQVRRKGFNEPDRRTFLIFTIPSKVSNECDKAAFSKLYELAKKRTKPNKVFLYGLYYCCEEYVRIEKHVTDCVKEATNLEELIMRISCFVWIYSKKPIKLYLLNRLIQRSSENTFRISSDDEVEEDTKPLQKSGEKFRRHNEEMLGNFPVASDLMVVQGDGLKPAHNCIIHYLVKQLINENKAEQLNQFVRDLKNLFEYDRDDNKQESSEVLANILIRTKNPEIDKYFSEFIVDLETHCDKEGVLNVLTQIIEMVSDKSDLEPHIRALYSRYLLYKMNDPELAVQEMKKALGIEGTADPDRIPVNDHILLYIYGNLLRERVRRTSHKEFQNDDEFLAWAEAELVAAISSYKKAQESSSSIYMYSRTAHLQFFNSRSFVGEAQAWLLLLNLHFKIKCKNNIKVFRAYLSMSGNQRLMDVEKEALMALDNLEYLESLDKLTERDLTITKSQAIKARLDLLRFHFSEKERYINKLRFYPKNTPMDIGCIVRHYMTREETETRYQMTAWKDLPVQKLDIIVNTVADRLSEKTLRENIMLRANYRDFLYALVYRSQPLPGRKPETQYNLPYASEIARQWVMSEKRKRHEDQEAFFMLGVLTLIQGLDEEERLLIEESRTNFERCRYICEQNKSIEAYRKKRFIIGKGTGLE